MKQIIANLRKSYILWLLKGQSLAKVRGILAKAKGPLYVVNSHQLSTWETSQIPHARHQQAEILFSVPKFNGADEARHLIAIKIPAAWIPIDLTMQAPLTNFGWTADFINLVERDSLRVIPEWRTKLLLKSKEGLVERQRLFDTEPKPIIDRVLSDSDHSYPTQKPAFHPFPNLEPELEPEEDQASGYWNILSRRKRSK